MLLALTENGAVAAEAAQSYSSYSGGAGGDGRDLPAEWKRYEALW